MDEIPQGACCLAQRPRVAVHGNHTTRPAGFQDPPGMSTAAHGSVEVRTVIRRREKLEDLVGHHRFVKVVGHSLLRC